MEIFNNYVVSLECDGCKKAFPSTEGTLTVPMGSTLPEMLKRVRDFHRAQSPRCPRDSAQLTTSRSFADEFNQRIHTPHFRMIWRDADELDLTKEERKTPMIVIG